MYRYLTEFMVKWKKNKDFLVLAIFSLFSVKSFANDVDVDKKETVVEENKNIDDDFDIILDELEEIDKNGNPNYISKIFFSLPAGWGFNYPIKNNEKDDKEVFSFIGSRALNLALFINFPLPFNHFFVSAGAEFGSSSLYWEGRKKIGEIKVFSDENSNLLEKEQENAIDFTKFSFWKAGFCAKVTCFFDKFDPRDGFYFSINGGGGLRFWGEFEQGFQESFNETRFIVADNDELFDLKKYYYFVGVEAGYQRFGFFYKQIFSSIFNGDKISEKKVCSYPFCFGFSFDLL